jgi:hypothetical protein
MNTYVFACVLALALAVGSAQATLFFCEDSQWDPVQPSFASGLAFYQERAKFKELRDYFYDITRNVDLGNTTVEQHVIDQLLAKLTAKGYPTDIYSFTITRSNGDITMDTTLGVNPVIDNHGGRYSLGKPMLCRDFEPIVFDYTYVTRVAKQVKFWSQAVQTSVQKQWFSFRWNIFV